MQQAATWRLIVLGLLALIAHGGFAVLTIMTESGTNMGILPMGDADYVGG